jgi:hypothetical protein
MKKITVAGWTLDNAGNYHPAGTELTIADGDDEGCIDADRAAALAKVEAARAKSAKTDPAADAPEAPAGNADA